MVTEVLQDRDELLGTVRVKAEVCQQCGEVYFSPRSAEKIWQEWERLKAKQQRSLLRRLLMNAVMNPCYGL